MEIKTIGIIGLGALGTMYGNYMAKKMARSGLYIIANENRIKRYQQEGVFCNGQLCHFSYINPDIRKEPIDLLIFTVKFSALQEAIEEAKQFIGKDTIILSMLNGIVSEEIIRKNIENGHILYCTVQGMDAVKLRNEVDYQHLGYVAFGEKDGSSSEAVKRVKRFFNLIELPYQIPDDMMHQMWGKLLLNVGVNQAVAVFETDYGGIQEQGEARRCMIGAMNEVLTIAKVENISMEENEIDLWLNILDTLSPQGKPSLRQDTEAHRKTEVELFAGTIKKFGKKHGIPTPYNDLLYDRIKQMEKNY